MPCFLFVCFVCDSGLPLLTQKRYILKNSEWGRFFSCIYRIIPSIKHLVINKGWPQKFTLKQSRSVSSFLVSWGHIIFFLSFSCIWTVKERFWNLKNKQRLSIIHAHLDKKKYNSTLSTTHDFNIKFCLMEKKRKKKEW